MSESTSTSGPASSAKDPTSKRDLTGAISKMCGWFGGLAGRVKDGLPQVLGKAKGPQPPTTGKKPPKPWNSWWSKRSKRARLGLLIGGPLAVIVLAGLVVFLVLFLRPVFVVAAVEADDAVVSGEDVLVSVDVANEGRTTGDYELSVLVDGEEAWAELVTLDGETEEQVPIRLSGLSAGRYEISLAEWPESAQEVWVMTPAEFEIDRVEVQPDSIDFNTTNEAEVLVGFTNVGEAKGSYELEFALNGEVVEVREIELEGGLSADETFAVAVT